MRRIRYSVAMSLDGYIAGPKGEFDWIKTDPDFDFSAVLAQILQTLKQAAIEEGQWNEKRPLSSEVGISEIT